MNKILLFFLALSVCLCTLALHFRQRLTAERAESAKLRSSVQVLLASADRDAQAMATQRRKLSQAVAARVASSQALERALAASATWAATPVPQEVQDAP